MLQIHDFSQLDGGYRSRLPRAEFDVDQALAQVRPIADAVKTEGTAALRRFSEQFDGVVPESFRVPAHVLEKCAEELDPKLAESFATAIERRRAVCAELEVEPAHRDLELAPGAVVSQRIIPMERVGLYVPGGLAPLASSVIMNVVPAQVAGVSEIAVASPPQVEFGGLPHPNILALCHLLGVEEVYAVGGAQAIAMFAHGIEDLCEPVNLISGPGNIFVVAAKRLVRGLVGIDSEAGPTEIAILADDSANPAYVAADLISQAEHDPLAASVLVTDSPEFAERVNQEVNAQVPKLPLAKRITTALTGTQSAIVIVKDIAQGIDVVNAYAAEHLELQTRNVTDVMKQITNAGAIFVGDYSPVSLGDYSAGSTHVLPTAGCACHSSGLNVRSFMKAVHVINYSASALAEIADGVARFAYAEQLPGHAAAIEIRGE